MTWSRQKRQRNPLFQEFGAPSPCAWMEEGVRPKSKWSGTVAFGPMANPSGSYASLLEGISSRYTKGRVPRGLSKSQDGMRVRSDRRS